MLAAVRLFQRASAQRGKAAIRPPHGWHNCGMSRIRLSTTVSKELLDSARAIRSSITDATLIDEALEACSSVTAPPRSTPATQPHTRSTQSTSRTNGAISHRFGKLRRPPDDPAGARGGWCELAEAGRRPVVVLSRDVAIPRLRRALVAPCTTTIRRLASEVVLESAEDPIPLRSAVNLDSVESVPVAVLVDRLGRLADSRMRQICTALAVAVDCSE